MSEDRFKIWEMSLKTLTFVGLIIGACWAVFTYKDTKEKEFYTAYWNKKLELFSEASAAASTMATTTSVSEFNTARSKYSQLFFGGLSLVEGDAVKQAMETFSRSVPSGYIEAKDLPLHSMEQPTYTLTVALKQELGMAWKHPFSELGQAQQAVQRDTKIRR